MFLYGDLIFDRTIADVETARTVRQKVARGEIPTEQEFNEMNRGLLNYLTINRIEERQEALQPIIKEMGYLGFDITNETWNIAVDNVPIFKKSDFQRLINNNTTLQKAFLTYTKSPRIARAEYHYREINILEETIYDLERTVEDVKGNYRYCGGTMCGG